MISVKYIGIPDEADLLVGKEYQVIAISLPVPKLPFLRIIDESGEDYLYPWSCFEFVSGESEFYEIISDETPREESVA